MPSSPLPIVELLAAYHAGLLSLWLWRRPAAFALGALSLVFSAHMLANLATDGGLIPPPLDPTSAFGLLYGPLLLLFIRSLVREDGRVGIADGLHAVPALAMLAIRPALPIPQLVGFPLLVGYLWQSARLLAEHRRLAPQLRADDATVDLGWVRWTFAVFVVLTVIDLSRSAAAGALPAPLNEAILALTLASVVVLLSIMAWRATDHERQHGAIGEADATLLAPGAEAQATTDAAQFPLVDRVVREEELWREPRLSLARSPSGRGSAPAMSRAPSMSPPVRASPAT